MYAQKEKEKGNSLYYFIESLIISSSLCHIRFSFLSETYIHIHVRLACQASMI